MIPRTWVRGSLYISTVTHVQSSRTRDFICQMRGVYYVVSVWLSPWCISGSDTTLNDSYYYNMSWMYAPCTKSQMSTMEGYAE